MQNLDKEKYLYIGRYKSPLLYHSLLSPWYHPHLGEKYGLPKIEGEIIFLDGHMFVLKEDWNILKQKTEHCIAEQDDQFFMQFFCLAKETTEQMHTQADKLFLLREESHLDIKDFFKAMRELEYPWMMCLPIGEVLEESAKKLIDSINFPNDVLTAMFHPSQPTRMMRYQDGIKNLKTLLQQKGLLPLLQEKNALEKIKEKNIQIHRELRDHHQNNQWIGLMHFWGSPLGKEEFIDHLMRTQQKDKDLPQKLLWLMEKTRAIAYWRNTFAETCSIATFKGLRALERASSSMDLTWKDASFLTPDEFLSGMQGDNLPINKLHERKAGFGLIPTSDILTNNSLLQAIQKMVPTADTQEIKGTIVHQGKVRGKAKIVLSPHDNNKVLAGDIIVAPETTPDFLPALHKAIAIVTDMGGLICHAAIVARELNKPCIVGTKIATQLLKDGDLIEVDAFKGIVKKL